MISEFTGGSGKDKMTTGPLVTISEAAEMGGVHRETIRKYIAAGYLQTHMDGYMVYYRDVLRASRIADEKHKANSGKASPNYKKVSFSSAE